MSLETDIKRKLSPAKLPRASTLMDYISYKAHILMLTIDETIQLRNNHQMSKSKIGVKTFDINWAFENCHAVEYKYS